ncbi:beta-amyrin 28-monooxygenase-like [Rutidosis leptorrhynchoides]|uniref:beta-amyrin 28-monooxygenase-like n=1 Tax=Rutidosis leptorrhynchoides TaxID=125765 RepID=UPI003A9A4450
MDILYTSASLLSLVLVIYFYIHFFVYRSKPFNDQKLLPRGNKGWPVIGENYEFLAAGWKGHPEKCWKFSFIYDRMSIFSSIVFRTSLLLEDVAVLCGSQGNKFVFSNENKNMQAWLPASVLKIFPASPDTYKAENTKFRKFLVNTLKKKALQQFVPIMDNVTQRYFETEWNGKKEIMAYELAKTFAFGLACKIFLSIDDPELIGYLSGSFENIITGLFSMPIDLPMTPYRKAINAVKVIRKELVVIAKQREIDLDEGKATPTQDILSHMILLNEENGEFPGKYELIADKIQGLLMGGHDTLSSVCSSLVKFLAELPEIYNGIYVEQIEIAKSKAPGEPLVLNDLSKMKYSWKVACEVLRLSPMGQGYRQVITDIMYNGYHIPKGWKIYWTAASTHKNPEYFPEPEKFDPSRFEGNGPEPYTFVPFGGGAHLCPGKEYARLAILVFMHHLVTKFKWEKTFADEQIVYNPMPKPDKGLPIRIYPHIS